MGRLFFFAKVRGLLRADKNGIYREVRGDVFGLGRKVPIMNVRWDEIASVSRDNSRGVSGIRIYPKDPNLFRNPFGITRSRLPTAEDGSTLITMSEPKAQELYETCLGFLRPDGVSQRAD
jgi:hypothetical protein